MSASNEIRCDIAVVGGGAAGLHVSLEAAAAGARVVLVSRKSLADSSSYWAQGGLAAALADDDSPERHAADTLAAGRGICRTSTVDVLTREAAASVAQLESQGVEFDRDSDGALGLGLEGGHSARRIVHAGGSETGRAITSRLAELVAADPGIEVLEGASATALLTQGDRCLGVVTDRGNVVAAATALTTGGGAALWQRTTNPWGAIGAGLILAHQAGAQLADLEFCQFHPTALQLPGNRRDGALITEAVRGEGAELLDASGSRFTDELAPRDQVSAAILDRIDADGTNEVWLDMTKIPPDRFPNVFATCRDAGLDPSAKPVPVAPASHYLIGGITATVDGQTTLPGLYAVGECACTGLHGANRLASNSLSECFVFGSRAARMALGEPSPPSGAIEAGEWRFTPPTPATRAAVWALAGPRRRAEELEQLLEDPYPLAQMIARSALTRHESRGTHRRAEFPLPNPTLEHSHLVVDRTAEPEYERWI